MNLQHIMVIIDPTSEADQPCLRRAENLARFYPDGLPECTKGVEGIAQQYLFDYVRNNGGLND